MDLRDCLIFFFIMLFYLIENLKTGHLVSGQYNPKNTEKILPNIIETFSKTILLYIFSQKYTYTRTLSIPNQDSGYKS